MSSCCGQRGPTILSLITSTTSSSPTFPFALFIPVTLASWLLVKHIKKVPAPGPLHLLFSLPICSYPRYPRCSPSYFMLMFAQTLPYQRSSLSTLLKNSTFPPYPAPFLSVSLLCFIFLCRTHHQQYSTYSFVCLCHCLSPWRQSGCSLRTGTLLCSLL